MKIHKNDTILVTKGKYRGKISKILKSIPKENRVIVEGVNIVKKHARPQKSGEKGKILEIPSPISVANVKLVCKKCKKPTKVEYKFVIKKEKQIKVRICKKCGRSVA